MTAQLQLPWITESGPGGGFVFTALLRTQSITEELRVTSALFRDGLQGEEDIFVDHGCA